MPADKEGGKQGSGSDDQTRTQLLHEIHQLFGKGVTRKDKDSKRPASQVSIEDQQQPQTRAVALGNAEKRVSMSSDEDRSASPSKRLLALSQERTDELAMQAPHYTRS